MAQPVYPIEYPDCPNCGAKAGKYCKRPSGHSGPFVSPHKARTIAAGGKPLTNAGDVPYPSGYPACRECDAGEGESCKAKNGRRLADPHKSREVRMKVDLVLPPDKRKGPTPPFGFEDAPPAPAAPKVEFRPVIAPTWFEVYVDGQLAGSVFEAVKRRGWVAETPDGRTIPEPARDRDAAADWLTKRSEVAA